MFVKTNDEGNIIENRESETFPLMYESYKLNKIPSRSFFFIKSDSEKSQIFINMIVIMLIGAVVFILLTMRNLFVFPVFIFIYLFVIAYMIIDFLIWRKRGIRTIFLSENGIFLYTGKENKEEFIPYEAITGIDLHKKGARKIINILLKGKADKTIPGVTLFLGKRKRIINDAFNDKKFERMIELLASKWGKRESENNKKV